MLRLRNRLSPPLALAAVLLTLSFPRADLRQEIAASGGSEPEKVSVDPSFALIVIRTLVIDALGTRTLDTDSARVPFGKSGLLIKNMPRVGAPLALRLNVLALPPQETGIPVTLTAELWNGDAASPPLAHEISRREEATILGPESSYLLELEYDPIADRRLVLSLRAHAGSEGGIDARTESVQVDSLQFLISLLREPAAEGGGPDVHTLMALQGHPASYTSGIRSGDRFVGLTLTLTADRIQGDLVTVRSEISGAEFMDPARTILQPFRTEAVHTVTFDSVIDLSITVQPPEIARETPPPSTLQAVTWHVHVTLSRRTAAGVVNLP